MAKSLSDRLNDVVLHLVSMIPELETLSPEDQIVRIRRVENWLYEIELSLSAAPGTKNQQTPGSSTS